VRCERCCSMWVCVVEGGTPLFIQGLRRWYDLYLAWNRSSTASTWEHATAYWRGGWAAPVGGHLPLGVGHPLTEASRHCLRVAGSRMYLDHSTVVLCPVCTKLMGVSLVPLRKLASKSTFRWIIPCICVCISKIIITPNFKDKMGWFPKKRTKWDAESYVRLEISRAHKTTNCIKYHHECLLHHEYYHIVFTQI
jgi:hypothetical protein